MSTKARIILAIVAVVATLLLLSWLVNVVLGWLGPIVVLLVIAAAGYFGYRALSRRNDATGWMTRRLSRQLEEKARKQMADLERRQKQR